MPDNDRAARKKRMAEMLPGWRVQDWAGFAGERNHVAWSPDNSVSCRVTGLGPCVRGCGWAMVGPNAVAMLATQAGYIQQARAWLAAETAAREEA